MWKKAILTTTKDKTQTHRLKTKTQKQKNKTKSIENKQNTCTFRAVFCIPQDLTFLWRAERLETLRVVDQVVGIQTGLVEDAARTGILVEQVRAYRCE
jgi:hypothetical protein